MSKDNAEETPEQIRKEIIEGLDADEANLKSVLDALKKRSVNYLTLLRQAVTFLKQLTVTETPDEPSEIEKLSKEEIIFITWRVNLFERLRLPAVDDEQLEHLLERTHELWGEHPTEPIGRWVEWCLWTHLHRRRNSIPISQVIAGEPRAKELKRKWVERHREREERRRQHKIDNYDRYETPEDVPPSIQHMVMSPFIKESEMDEVENRD
jgi:hypothetical protein